MLPSFGCLVVFVDEAVLPNKFVAVPGAVFNWVAGVVLLQKKTVGSVAVLQKGPAVVPVVVDVFVDPAALNSLGLPRPNMTN